MSDELPGRRSLESLKKEAKRWLAALRTNAADARARVERALGSAPDHPTLRDVQHALAREHGFPGWTALKDALESDRAAGNRSMARYEAMAAALLDAYRTGTPEAMERHYQLTWHRRAWPAMRRYVQLDLGKRPAGPDEDVEITLDDARYLVAIEHGFASWDDLTRFTATAARRALETTRPVRVMPHGARDESTPIGTARDWDTIIELLAANPSAELHAPRQMTDDALARVARVETITGIGLAGSPVTDDGLRHLARLPRLERLELSGTAITDRGLEVVRHLPALRVIWLGGTRITDAGVAHLAHCPNLERVYLAGTETGDAAIGALAGKTKLGHLSTGNRLTDAGIPLLHELPVFKTWQGGEPEIALLSYDSEPNNLALRGTFTDRGMQRMRGLDGLFGLNLDDSRLAITAAALEPLVSLPNLGALGVDAKDDWMSDIAAMPHLRFLGAQDTTASDDGFVAVAKSRSIEIIWGRRCHNLRTRGFLALATMPSLRGLSVSCLNVDDAGIAALPSFPALRELMPMDIPDAGYQHIGECAGLESLILMYCRNTTDAATEHITRLSKLGYYFNSYTTITDRTPELLSGMDSLERITFDGCHGLTNAGVARLARLPKLRELRVSGRRITNDLVGLLPPGIEVHAGG